MTGHASLYSTLLTQCAFLLKGKYYFCFYIADSFLVSFLLAAFTIGSFYYFIRVTSIFEYSTNRTE